MNAKCGSYALIKSILGVQMTVLQIAALKKVKKGTTVLLMDKNGGGAKAIARELSGRGFRRVFVISGGFQGWTGSKLQTRLSSSVSPIEILSPGNIFGTQRMATQRSTQVCNLDRFEWCWAYTPIPSR